MLRSFHLSITTYLLLIGHQIVLLPSAFGFTHTTTLNNVLSKPISMKPISSSTAVFVQDDSVYEYSRCLTPKQEQDQIDAELGVSNIPLWKRVIKKPVKTLGKVVARVTKSEVKPGALILVRGGESEFSQKYVFTGWADPKLTPAGRLQMEHAGRLLLEAGYDPDVIYTSRLKRAIQSVWAICEEISAPYLPVYKSWRLNERHYGSLTGLNKKDTALRLGADVVQAWRRSLKARPPPVKETDKYYPGNDRKYADLLPEQIPVSESLLDCMLRTKPLWEYKISRELKKGNNVLVVGHANSLRGLVKIIEDINDDDIAEVSFPKGIPVVYKFDKNMNIIKPSDTSLTQVHASGQFLEKPGLLKKAIETQKNWETFVPGSTGVDMPKVAKRMSTLESSLLKLREEQEEYSKAEDDNTKDKTKSNDDKVMGSYVRDGRVVLATSEDGLATTEKDERFEEDSGISNLTEVTANVNEVNIKKDPVVVLVRHGRTPHNKLALFTGWEDPPLAVEGEDDAKNAGKLLKKHGFEFDVVFTSWLYRAIQTAWFILEEMDLLWLPVIQSWRLNERHYGALTGKSKKMVGNIYGEDQLKKWRKGYTIRPPAVSSYSLDYPGNDLRRTKAVTDIRISVMESISRSIEARKLILHRKFPKTESLRDCMDRSIPFYTQKIVPEAVAKGKRVLITSHENAIRGILMHLCEIPEECMNDLNLPNGVPLVYNVRRKCISLLDDGSGVDPMTKYDFGSAAQYLFRPCELDDDFFDQMQAAAEAKQPTLSAK